MAQFFLPQSAERTVQVLGPNKAVPVMAIGFTTIPSQVFAQAYVTLDQWAADSGFAAINAIAEGIETAMGIPGVVDAVFEQDISPAGLLTDSVVFTVGIVLPKLGQFGPMTAEVRVNVFVFGEAILRGPLIDEPIAAAQAALLATANL